MQAAAFTATPAQACLARFTAMFTAMQLTAMQRRIAFYLTALTQPFRCSHF
jgi:hypothetical protein